MEKFGSLDTEKRKFRHPSLHEFMSQNLESTNARVLYLSIFSMLCLLGLATWQVLYLRRYFKAKVSLSKLGGEGEPIRSILFFRSSSSSRAAVHSAAVFTLSEHLQRRLLTLGFL